jgi:hypothetical protein
MAVLEDRLARRRERQRSVESLLAELDERRRTVYRLLAAGAQPAGLRDAKSDVAAARRRLAALVT